MILALSFSWRPVYASEKYNVDANFEYIRNQALNIFKGSTKVFNKDNVDITSDFIKRFPTESNLKDNAISEILNEQYYLVEDLNEGNIFDEKQITPYGLVNHSYSKKVTQTTSTYKHDLLPTPKSVTVSYLIRGTVSQDSQTGKVTNFSAPVVNLTYSSEAINKFSTTTSTPIYLPGNYGIRIATSVNFMYFFQGNAQVPARLMYSSSL